MIGLRGLGFLFKVTNNIKILNVPNLTLKHLSQILKYFMKIQKRILPKEE